MNKLNNEQSITLNVSCVQSKYVSDLKLKAVLHNKGEQDIECNNAKLNIKYTKLVYENLECNIEYNISIYWISHDDTFNNHYCLFEHMILTPPCNGKAQGRVIICETVTINFYVLQETYFGYSLSVHPL